MKKIFLSTVPLLLASCMAMRTPYYDYPNGYAETKAEQKIEYPYTVWATCGTRMGKLEFLDERNVVLHISNMAAMETERYSYYVEKKLTSKETPKSEWTLCGVHLRVKSLDEGWSGHMELCTRGRGDFGVRVIKNRNAWYLEDTHDKTLIKRLCAREGSENAFITSGIPALEVYNHTEGRNHIHKFKGGNK